MQNYHDLLQYILDYGIEKKDRTGVGTISVFGHQLRFDLEHSFPLITTKKVHFKSIVYELLWFLKGESNIAYLNKNNVTIWDEWADKQGDLGPVYGVQWRKWQAKDGKFYDQIQQTIEQIKNNPDSRRHLVSAWNVAEIDKMALPPCHVLFQFYVAKGRLSCHMYQRSADVFLGVPFNIASYGLLTAMVAHVTNLIPHELIISFGDAHIYSNHLEQVRTQLKREHYPLPTLNLNTAILNIDDFKFEDIILENYHSHPAIKATIAV